MKIWNTLVPVVANVEADTAKDAIGKVAAALEHAGFIPFEPEREGSAFESEADVTEEDGMPKRMPGYWLVSFQG